MSANVVGSSVGSVRVAAPRSCAEGHTRTATARTNITTMKITNQGISPAPENAWTDWATPERVRNVPKTVSRKVMASSQAIQPFCSLRRRAMLME